MSKSLKFLNQQEPDTLDRGRCLPEVRLATMQIVDAVYDKDGYLTRSLETSAPLVACRACRHVLPPFAERNIVKESGSRVPAVAPPFCGTQHHKTLPPAIWGRA